MNNFSSSLSVPSVKTGIQAFMRASADMNHAAADAVFELDTRFRGYDNARMA